MYFFFLVECKLDVLFFCKSLLSLVLFHHSPSKPFTFSVLYLLCPLPSLSFTFSVGSYDVILDEAHFRDVLLQHCRPPPAKVRGWMHHSL